MDIQGGWILLKLPRRSWGKGETRARVCFFPVSIPKIWMRKSLYACGVRQGRTIKNEVTYEMDLMYSDTATTFMGGWMATDLPLNGRATDQFFSGNPFALEGSVMKEIF